jgi:CDGSH-type Zn-finger protein
MGLVRLPYTDMASGPAPSEAISPLTIVVKPHGTIVIEGEVTVRHPDGTVITPPPAKQPGIVKLCGCGKSGNKPFCDGSHKVDRAGNGKGETGGA